MEINRIPTAEEAISEIKKTALNASTVDEKVRLQLKRNIGELDGATAMLAKEISERGELNVLNTLQLLEDWMMHNRALEGAFGIFVALRVLGVHLTTIFFQRYR